MKNFILTLFLALSVTYSIKAQLTEGHFTYTIEASSENPDMQMVTGMMQGSTLDIHFKDKITRSEMKMGSMMNIVTVSNENSGEILLLMSGMIGKNAILMTTEEVEALSEGKPEMNVELLDETKTIEGYLCKKAVLSDENGGESIFWYTEEIEISKVGQTYLNKEVPGFPMQYDLNNNGLKMTMTVSKFEKKLDKNIKSLFDMNIPEGYKTLTLEELEKMGM
jgi:GLPGLI family protein